jgi:hypothetical protein
MNVLRMDKKRVKDSMNYVLLNKIGQAAVRVIPIVQLEKLLQSILAAGGGSSDRTDISKLRAECYISGSATRAKKTAR